MTKKDYIVIASILKNERRKALSDQDFTSKVKNLVISNIARGLATFFESNNTRFDGQIFLDATQLTEEEMRLPL